MPRHEVMRTELRFAYDAAEQFGSQCAHARYEDQDSPMSAILHGSLKARVQERTRG